MKVILWLKEHKVLFFILLIGAFLRIYKIDNQSLWIDELFTMNISNPNNSFGFIYDFLKNNDPHPPLFYFLAHTFLLLFGFSSLTLKGLSAFVGILGVFSAYFLGKELVNKEVGILTTFLTAINYFHIYYSQEGRMYSLFFLTTCIAILSFSKFLRKMNKKTMVFFIIGSTLMIYTHFFGVFLLISLYIIIVTSIIKSKHFLATLKYLITSGLITLVLYTPAIIIIFSNPDRDVFWIKAPNLKTFEFMFKEFFGYSSATVFLIIVLLVLSIIIFSIRRKNNSVNNNIFNYSLKIIFVTISITILLSLLYSYLKLPIVVSRYFICILPLILVLISITIYKLRNRYVKLIAISVFFVLSLKNIIYERHFYDSFYKTQFKHAIGYIIQKEPNDIIVYKYGDFYLRFYLNEVNYHKTTVENDINTYVQDLIVNKNKISSFWYFDGHLPNYSVSKETKDFLNENYEIDYNKIFFDAYVKHFKVKNKK